MIGFVASYLWRRSACGDTKWFCACWDLGIQDLGCSAKLGEAASVGECEIGLVEMREIACCRSASALCCGCGFQGMKTGIGAGCQRLAGDGFQRMLQRKWDQVLGQWEMGKRDTQEWADWSAKLDGSAEVQRWAGRGLRRGIYDGPCAAVFFSTFSR